MRLNLEMLVWGMCRLRHGRSPDLSEIATREWELCPEEITVTPGAIYLDGALEQIKALSPWRNWQTERELIGGGECTHAASKAYVVNDVALSGAYLYRGAAKDKRGFGEERLVVGDHQKRVDLDVACLLSGYPGSHFFGNHLLDDFPLGLIPEPGSFSIAVPTKPYEHADGYRQLVSLPNPTPARRARIRQLTLYSDFAQNSFKAARYRELRARMRSGLAGSATGQGPGIYLKRGGTGEPRILANEAEVEGLLRDLGFEVVEPAALSAEQIARRSLGARIVVSVEGSQLSHVIYTVADDGAFLVLQPPDRFAMAYKEFTDRLDLRFAFVVGRPADGGFAIDLAELQRILDRLT